MDIKKVEELIRMKNNCAVAIETLNTELLGNIANGIARLVALEEDKISGQMSMDLRPQPTPEVKETVVEKVKPVEKILPTKEEVMKELVAFIQSNGESKLADILESIGGYKTFPAVPQEKYKELLYGIWDNEIN